MISMILYGLVLVIIIYVLLNFMIFGRHAFSQDADPRYYCIEKFNTPYPYNELCREQIMKEIMNYTDGLEK